MQQNNPEDFTYFFGLLWQNKLLLIALSLLGAIIAGVVAYTSTPVFRAQALLSPAVEQTESPLTGIGGSIAGLAGFSANNDQSKVEALALMTSRSFTEKMIAEEGLMTRIFYEEWDEQSKTWTGDFEDEEPSLWRAFEKFDRSIRHIQEDDESGLVTVSIDWVDREEAARWAQMIVDRVNSEMQDRAIKNSANRLNYLQQELEKTSIVELKTAIYGLIESEIKSSMVANVNNEYSFKVIDPPLVPDASDQLRPKPVLMVLAGFTAGIVVGVLFLLLYPGRRKATS